MEYQVYAMDTYFYHSQGSYDFEARCEMLQELGYHATYLTLWNEPSWEDISKLKDVKRKYGLDVDAVFIKLNMSQENDSEYQRTLRMLEGLEGVKRIEVALVGNGLDNSDKSGDPYAVKLLQPILDICQTHNMQLCLYPHINFWLERMEDALRICKAVDHPCLGITFSGFHWYAVDGLSLQQTITACAPYLFAVNLCGTRRIPASIPSIETLDEGELDNFYLLGLLLSVGYKGLIGFQGFSVGGDAYAKLRRSLHAFQDMSRRLKQHRDWSVLRAEASP
jgi:sugar phosphate isomerase/epimerase